MEKGRSQRNSPPGGAMTAAIALLLVVCLAECATGSCLSYGHSCWGAHGKRSGKPPGAAPDWFLNKLFRRTDTGNTDLHHSRARNDEISAIFGRDDSIASPSVQDRTGSLDRMDSGVIPMEMAMTRDPEAKPMLDDELLYKIKVWQKMREAAEEQ